MTTPLEHPAALCRTVPTTLKTAGLWDVDHPTDKDRRLRPIGPDGAEELETEEMRRDARYEVAVRICERCPIRRECYDYALETRQVGVWGAMVFPEYHTAQVRCARCEVRIHGLRKDHVKHEPAGTEHFCKMCAKDSTAAKK